MKNKYTYTDHAPIFIGRQRLYGALASILHGGALRKLRIIAVTGKAGKTEFCLFLEQITKKASRSVAILSEKGAVVIRDGVIVWRKEVKHFEELSPLMVGGFLSKAAKEGITDVFIEVNSWHIISGTFGFIPFDGVTSTYFSIKEVPTAQEEEDFFIVKKYLLDRIPYMERKATIEKILFMNNDDFYHDDIAATVVDQTFAVSMKRAATLQLKAYEIEDHMGEGVIHIPNATLPFRTNRPDQVGIAIQLMVFVYCMSQGWLTERLTEDVAFALPQTVLPEIPHILGLPIDDTMNVVRHYAGGKMKKAVLILVLESLDEQTGRVIQGFLHEEATVLLWVQHARKSRGVVRMLLNTYAQADVPLYVFTRPQELYLKARLLQKEKSVMLIAPKKEIVEVFSKKARK